MKYSSQPVIYPASRLLRVSRKKPCRICRKTGWCSYTEDGGLVLCMRTSAGSTKQARNGAYVHVLRTNLSFPTSTSTTPVIGKCGDAEGKKAAPNQLDAVYRTLLEHPILLDSSKPHPALSPEHANDLLVRRGLSDSSIAANLYTSVPDKTAKEAICEDLSTRFDLRSIPGFYKAEEHWQLNTFGKGYFIPYRDVEGRVTGLQVRLDSGQPRYIWLSSAGKPKGSSSGCPLHFTNPDVTRRTNSALITEGALKADIVSDYTGVGCIAVAGVTATNAEELVSQVKLALPDLQKIILAFDGDWRENVFVKNAILRLINAFEERSLEVTVRTWDVALGKGIDDVYRETHRRIA